MDAKGKVNMFNNLSMHMVILPLIQPGQAGVQKLKVVAEHTQVLVAIHLYLDLEDTYIPLLAEC
eukprot:10699413-Prorocentrum_lima.AAC.1